MIRSYAKISQPRIRTLQLHVLNVKVLVGSFHQEKALVGSLSVIVKSSDDLRLKL